MKPDGKALLRRVCIAHSIARSKESQFVNFTGAKVKKSRALGVALTPKAQKYMKNRPFPPGQHGQRRRRRPSDYGVQLLEKQRLRFQYNISEKQLARAYKEAVRMGGATGDNLVQLLEKQRMRFQYNISESQLRKAYQQATRMPGSTGDNLVQILETRMDCLVLRAGLAPTIYAARQYVTHGHFLLNGKKATIPSQRLKVGDVISVREKSRKSVIFAEIGTASQILPYMTVDPASFSAKFDYMPPREEIPVMCAEHLVVEYYSR